MVVEEEENETGSLRVSGEEYRLEVHDFMRTAIPPTLENDMEDDSSDDGQIEVLVTHFDKC